MTVDGISQQLLFVWSLAAGGVLGGVYDVFRLIRLFGLRNKAAVFLQDVIFCLLCAAAYVLLLYNFSSGVIRLYSLIAMLIGFLLWHITAGVLIMRCADGLRRLLCAAAAKIRDFVSRVVSTLGKRIRAARSRRRDNDAPS